MQPERLTKIKGGDIMKLIDRFIYSITTKPKHYVEVKNPPKTTREKLARPQDARQMQYNRWSRRYKVYSGSYLPKDHNDLIKKGWKSKKVSDSQHHFYQRKSTNQTIRYDDDRINNRGKFEKGHYHWYIWWKNYFGKKTEKHFRKKQRNNNNTEKVYYNEYGEKTSFGNWDHHIFR
jgi:hypothetical protein